MSTQDPSLLTHPQNPTSLLWKTLYRIQESLNINNTKMAQLLHLLEKDFLNLKKAQKEPIIRSIMGLSEALNISFDSIIMGEIDYVTMTRQFQGDKTYIPEKYLQGALGKQRIAMDYLSRVEATLGWEARVYVMRHLQITEASLSNPDAPINLRLTTDILNWIRTTYKSNEILLHMGKGAITAQASSPIGEALKPAKNISQLFDLFFGGVLERYWEKNYIWKIHSMTALSVQIRGTPNPAIVGFVDPNAIKSHSMCILRRGMVGAIPTLLGYSNSEAKKKSCISSGDSYCEFELNFEHIIKQQRRFHVLQ